MQQCFNCKCQVGSGISTCPYCGAQLPIEDYRKVEQRPVYVSGEETVQRGGTYRVTHVVQTPERTYTDGRYQLVEVPSRGEQVMYYCADYQRRWSSTEILLLVLLLGVLVASLFEFMAVLLLLLQ